jgi:hypothetical protein
MRGNINMEIKYNNAEIGFNWLRWGSYGFASILCIEGNEKHNIYISKYIKTHLNMNREIMRDPATNRSACPARGTHATGVSSHNTWRCWQANSLYTLQFLFKIARINFWTAAVDRAYALFARRPQSQAPATLLNIQSVSVLLASYRRVGAAHWNERWCATSTWKLEKIRAYVSGRYIF